MVRTNSGVGGKACPDPPALGQPARGFTPEFIAEGLQTFSGPLPQHFLDHSLCRRVKAHPGEHVHLFSGSRLAPFELRPQH